MIFTRTRAGLLPALATGLLAVGASRVVPAEESSPAPAPPPIAPDVRPFAVTPETVLEEISIGAPEPRYVAPTLRDRIGRIWAPVLINGKGPFRLVLDTGASSSAITAGVAQALGIPLEGAHSVMLRGVTGSLLVPAIHVDTLLVGDLQINSATLPIVPDALGGAQGVLGTEGLVDKRIFIDFMNDRISILRSRGRRSSSGFVNVPVQITPQRLLATRARVGSIMVKAIIDTGAQTSVANIALREALLRRRHYDFQATDVVGTTLDVQVGQGTSIPVIEIGGIRIQGARLTVGDLQIFNNWKMTADPVVLIGMDTLGLLDSLIIDYGRHELQIRPRQRDITLHQSYESSLFGH